MLNKTFSRYMIGIHLPTPLVKSAWLSQHLQSVKVVDGSYYLPAMGRNAIEEYNKARIPGAVFFDIDKISNKEINLPHMIPSVEQFERQVSDLGITQDDLVVVYDGLNIFSACRVYWTFKYFGHKHISVLDGGFPIWKLFDNPVDKTPPTISQRTEYKAHINPEILRTFDQIHKNQEHIKKGDKDVEKVIDMRPSGRFTGEIPEPREGLESGHMPYSKNIPFQSLINPKTGEMVHEDEIRHLLHTINVDHKKDKIVLSCGSGLTASIMYVALEKIGAPHKAVYDGSWTEYAQKGDKAPIMKSYNKHIL